MERIVKYVDYSSKYGMGYKLSNGSYGVVFNDQSKIVMHPNMFHFEYIDKSKEREKAEQYSFFSYPETLSKKVILL